MLHWKELEVAHSLCSSNFYSTPLGRFFRGCGVVFVAPTTVLVFPDALFTQLSWHLVPPLPSDASELGLLVVNCSKSFCRYTRDLLETHTDRIIFDCASPLRFLLLFSFQHVVLLLFYAFLCSASVTEAVVWLQLSTVAF